MSNPHSTISPPPLLKNTTETPAINSVPVELDSTPTTAEAVELKRRSTNPSVAVLSPDLEEAEVLKELGIESAGGGGGAEGEKLREVCVILNLPFPLLSKFHFLTFHGRFHFMFRIMSEGNADVSPTETSQNASVAK